MEQTKFSPELFKAIQEGFTVKFTFTEGFLCCELDASKTYATKDVVKELRPCPASETTLYRIETPDGLKGHAIVMWEEAVDD